MTSITKRQQYAILGLAILAIAATIGILVWASTLGTEDDYIAPQGTTTATQHDNGTVTLTITTNTATDAATIALDNSTYTLPEPDDKAITICSPTITADCTIRTDTNNGTITVIGIRQADNGAYFTTHFGQHTYNFSEQPETPT